MPDDQGDARRLTPLHCSAAASETVLMRSTLSCANGAEDPDVRLSERTRVHDDDVRYAGVLDPVITDGEEA